MKQDLSHFNIKYSRHNGGTHECITTTVTSYTAKNPKDEVTIATRNLGSKEIIYLKQTRDFLIANIIYSAVKYLCNWQCINFYTIL